MHTTTTMLQPSPLILLCLSLLITSVTTAPSPPPPLLLLLKRQVAASSTARVGPPLLNSLSSAVITSAINSQVNTNPSSSDVRVPPAASTAPASSAAPNPADALTAADNPSANTLSTSQPRTLITNAPPTTTEPPQDSQDADQKQQADKPETEQQGLSRGYIIALCIVGASAVGLLVASWIFRKTVCQASRDFERRRFGTLAPSKKGGAGDAGETLNRELEDDDLFGGRLEKRKKAVAAANAAAAAAAAASPSAIGDPYAVDANGYAYSVRSPTPSNAAGGPQFDQQSVVGGGGVEFYDQGYHHPHPAPNGGDWTGHHHVGAPFLNQQQHGQMGPYHGGHAHP
ncbi:hypothetical protein HDU67_006161 [Dinochytrium kinnereticum]|nr:hypothetical protein HDU67_006161 [Dinochytrium kinnereticum]